MNKIPIEKQIEFIEVFKEARQDYVEYADLLKAILNNATEKLGFFAEVKARAKTIASFSTKIISKDKYQNPKREGSDGFLALQRIKKVGINYKAPRDFETFGSRPFQDAYGEKIRN